MIVLLNYGLGNLKSVKNALDRLNLKHIEVTHQDDPSLLTCEVTHFILPGVGAFDQGMSNLIDRGLDTLIHKFHQKGVKGLGICLGMQLFCSDSLEGGFLTKGLGLFNANVKYMSPYDGPIPHIGWTTISNPNSSYEHKGDMNNPLYYVHSLHVQASEDTDVASYFTYGSNTYTSSLYKSNLLGVQFHPEKSQESGLLILSNYLRN